MRACVFAVCLAGCATSQALRAPELAAWPAGWQACPAAESEAQLARPPLTGEESCGLGSDACLASERELEVCAARVPASPAGGDGVQHELVMFARSDERGRVAPVCLAATSLADPAPALECVRDRLARVETVPGIERAPLRLKLFNPGGAAVGDGRGLSQEAIMQTLSAAVPALRACSDEQQRRAPGTKGKLVLRWRIATDGKPWRVEVVSQEHAGSFFASCAVERLRELRFPVHETEGQPVVFPFKF